MAKTIRLYVPAYRPNSDAVTEDVAGKMTRFFGGATVYRDMDGYWETPSGEIDTNPVNVVECANVNPDWNVRDYVEDELGRIREKLNQEQVIGTISDEDCVVVEA